MIPSGWSGETRGLEALAEIFDREDYKLDPTGILTVHLFSTGGDPAALISCPPGKYYLWSIVSGSLEEILDPTSLKEILVELNDPSLSGVKMKEVETEHVEIVWKDPIVVDGRQGQQYERIESSQISARWTVDPTKLAEVAESFCYRDFHMGSTGILSFLLSNTQDNLHLLSCPPGTYFIWNKLTNSLGRILEPTCRDEIAATMRDPNCKGIKLERVKPTESESESDEPLSLDVMLFKQERIKSSAIPHGWSATTIGLAKEAEDQLERIYRNMDQTGILSFLLYHTQDNLHLFSCPPGTYYIWNQLSDLLGHILEPTNRDELVAMIGHPDWKDIKVERVEPRALCDETDEPIPLDAALFRILERIEPSKVPAGWTADMEELAGGFDPRFYQMNFDIVSPLLCRDDADLMALYSCPPGTYYLMSRLPGGLWRIIEPTDIDEILKKLRDPDWKIDEVVARSNGPDWKGIKTKIVKQIRCEVVSEKPFSVRFHKWDGIVKD